MQGASHAGSWYPRGSALNSLLAKVFSSAVVDKNIPGFTKAVISPHAGYSYCATTAAHVYSTIDPNKFNKVLILGPSHRLRLSDSTIVDATSMETPNGKYDLDPLTQSLLNNYPKLFHKLSIRTSEEEHSLEMMLPFLNYIFKDKPVTIIPIMVGQLSESTLRSTSSALEPIMADPQTLVVISSDFTHWGDRFGYTYLPSISGKIFERISKLDHDAMAAISTADPSNFSAYLKDTEATICGRMPILIAMSALKKYTVHWTHYSMSSEATSMSDSSVSYAGGIFRIKE